MVEAHKLWRFFKPDPVEVQRVADENHLHSPVARALVNRGLTDHDEIDVYLHPKLNELGDPFDLPDMDKAVPRVWEAIDKRERILVFGDYDVDGITSTALMVKVLTGLGATVSRFIPHRLDDGYGLTIKSLEYCLDNLEPGLIITVDCGTGAGEAIEVAKARGVGIIITDHHEPGEHPTSPTALVNPKLKDLPALQKLAGCGVAFKLCHAVVKVGRDEGRAKAESLDLRDFLYLVAMGTVADVVPLQGENRVLVQNGLQYMNRNPSPCVKALVQVAGIKGPIRGYHLGFMIGPRINAAGRMAHPATALELLLATASERCAELAGQLDEANKARQDIELGIFQAACDMVEAEFNPGTDFCVIAYGEGWHPGVVGIVASRLVARYSRPVIVLGINEEGLGKGSCRSIDGFDLVESLKKVSDCLKKFGGHTMAAGLEIKSEHIPEFKRRFNEVAKVELQGRELKPQQKIDGWLDLEEIDYSLLKEINTMSPFGCKNPVPNWAAKNVTVTRGPFVVGKRHLKLYFKTANGQMLEAFGFNMGDRDVSEGERLDIIFQITLNTYMDQNTLQLILQDFRTAENTDT